MLSLQFLSIRVPGYHKFALYVSDNVLSFLRFRPKITNGFIWVEMELTKMILFIFTCIKPFPDLCPSIQTLCKAGTKIVVVLDGICTSSEYPYFVTAC